MQDETSSSFHHGWLIKWKLWLCVQTNHFNFLIYVCSVCVLCIIFELRTSSSPISQIYQFILFISCHLFVVSFTYHHSWLIVVLSYIILFINWLRVCLAPTSSPPTIPSMPSYAITMSYPSFDVIDPHYEGLVDWVHRCAFFVSCS